MIINSQGKIFYGMHFYPGVAEYQEPDQEPFRVFINEDTIRKMSPSFAAKPIFVEHVDEVEEDLNELRNEADGWVVESFFNAADGKTWVKFIVVSDRGLRAIQRGFRLSNAYKPLCSNEGGTWNGVSYQRTVLGGEFEHLAIVQNPRYEESVIMTPEQFKAYNEEKTVELKRLANSKGDREVKFNIFKRQKVENSISESLEGMIVELPKSKIEVPLIKVINEYDTIMNMNGYANGDHMVKVGDKDEMSVNDLVKKHIEMCNEFEGLKAKNADGGEPGGDDDMDEEDVSMENQDLDIDQMGDVGDRGGDVSLDNEDDEADDDKEKDKKEKTKNAIDLKAQAKAKAARLKNAHLNAREEEVAHVDLAEDQIARGKARYGSGN